MRRRVTPAPPSPQLTIEPPPQAWPNPSRRKPNDDAARFRAELGLPADRPVVMTGHQPELWHTGILAKYIAARRFAQLRGAATAHVIVDTDEVDPGALVVPERRDNRWTRRTLRLLDKPPIGVPACSIAAAQPAAAEADAAPGFVQRGLQSIRLALAAHADAPSLAVQTSQALHDLSPDPASLDHPVYSSKLSQTTLFRALVDGMVSSPRACVDAHNRAVAAVPHAHVAPLAATDDRSEVPLWRIRPGKPRVRVYADQVSSIPTDELAPRALLLTGLLRLGACDLFIHGLGGGVYDRVTDAWLREWLDAPLAPSVVVSATLRLPLVADDIPHERDIEHAEWLAHRALHDPRLLDDAEAAEAKAALLREIESGAPGHRAAAFLRMHEVLHGYHERRRDALDRLRAEADALAARRDESSIISDRTWAFPLHPQASLDNLSARIAEAFA